MKLRALNSNQHPTSREFNSPTCLIHRSSVIRTNNGTKTSEMRRNPIPYTLNQPREISTSGVVDKIGVGNEPAYSKLEPTIGSLAPRQKPLVATCRLLRFFSPFASYTVHSISHDTKVPSSGEEGVKKNGIITHINSWLVASKNTKDCIRVVVG